MKRFLARILGFQVDTPNAPSADPVQLAYADALVILNAIYRGFPWSRRAFARRISQPRWERATYLLRSAEILDRRGRYLFDPARDQFVAEALIRDAANRERVKQKYKNYVAPR